MVFRTAALEVFRCVSPGAAEGLTLHAARFLLPWLFGPAKGSSYGQWQTGRTLLDDNRFKKRRSARSGQFAR